MMAVLLAAEGLLLVLGIILTVVRFNQSGKKDVLQMVISFTTLFLLGVLCTLNALEHYGVYEFGYTEIFIAVLLIVELAQLLLRFRKK